MSFGLFEQAAGSEQEAGLRKQAASDKLAGAIYDVRQEYGPFLFQARSMDEFRDRVAMIKSDNGVFKVIEAHLPPVTGTVRRIVGKGGALEKEFRALLATGTMDAAPPAANPPMVNDPLSQQPMEATARRRRQAGPGVGGSAGGGTGGITDFATKPQSGGGGWGMGGGSAAPAAPAGGGLGQSAGGGAAAPAGGGPTGDAKKLLDGLGNDGKKVTDAFSGGGFMDKAKGVLNNMSGPGTDHDMFQQKSKSQGMSDLLDKNLGQAPGYKNPFKGENGGAWNKILDHGADDSDGDGYGDIFQNQGVFSKGGSWDRTSGLDDAKELKPKGNWKGYLDKMKSSDSTKVQKQNFTGTAEDNFTGTAESNFIKGSAVLTAYVDWCDVNGVHPMRKSALRQFATSQAHYTRIARELLAAEHRLDEAEGVVANPYTGDGGGGFKGKHWDPTDKRPEADVQGYRDAGAHDMPNPSKAVNPNTTNPYTGQPPRGYDEQIKKRNVPGTYTDETYWPQPEVPGKHRPQDDGKWASRRVVAGVNRRQAQYVMAQYKRWCEAKGLRYISARNVNAFAKGDPRMATVLGIQIKAAIRTARRRQGAYDPNNAEDNEAQEEMQRRHKERGGEGNPDPREFWDKTSRRRQAAPDYLQKAEDALTQLLNQKAEEFQGTIAPLQQSLVTVQQALQLQQQSNPMNVLPPPGTVNVMPGQAAPGQVGQPDPSGGQDPQAAAAAALAPAQAAGQLPPGGADPGGGAPVDQSQGAPPPAAQQQMQAARSRRPFVDAHRRDVARNLRQAAGVLDLWNKFQGEHTLTGSEADFDQFKNQYGVGDQALNKVKQQAGQGITGSRLRRLANRIEAADKQPPNIAEEGVKQQWRMMDAQMSQAGYKFDKGSQHWQKPGQKPIRNPWPHSAKRAARPDGVSKWDPSYYGDHAYAMQGGADQTSAMFGDAAAGLHAIPELTSGPDNSVMMRGERGPKGPAKHRAGKTWGEMTDQDKADHVAELDANWEQPFDGGWMGTKHDKAPKHPGDFSMGLADDTPKKKHHKGTNIPTQVSDPYGGGEHAYRHGDPDQIFYPQKGYEEWNHKSGPSGPPYIRDQADTDYEERPLPPHKHEASRKQAWSGWGPAQFPKARKVAGWDWNEGMNGYEATSPRRFTCSCGSDFPTPTGFTRCACGKSWNSYVIGNGGNRHEASTDKFWVREIPTRPDVIVAANQRMARGDHYAPGEGGGKHHKPFTGWMDEVAGFLPGPPQHAVPGIIHHPKPGTLDDNYPAMYMQEGAPKGEQGRHREAASYVAWCRHNGLNPRTGRNLAAFRTADWKDKIPTVLKNRPEMGHTLKDIPEGMADNWHQYPAPPGWDESVHGKGAHPSGAGAGLSIASLVDPRTGAIHNLVDTGELGEGEDPGHPKPKATPKDWHHRDKNQRWTGK